VTRTSAISHVDERWESLAPSEEAQDLARTARDHFTALNTVELTRQIVGGQTRTPDLWNTIVDSGYHQIGIPEDQDGVGDQIDLVVLLEEAGRALLPTPLLATTATAQLHLTAGFTGHHSSSRPHAFAVASGLIEQETLSCEQVAVLDGAAAGHLTLLVEDDTVVHVAEIDVRSPGVAVIDGGNDFDPSRPLGRFRLAEVPVRQHHAIPRSAYHQLLSSARMCVAADLVGIAAGALDRAVEHVLQRQQFGRPLGAFQAIKHQLVDVYVAIEKARSLVLGTALAVRDQPMQPKTAQVSLFALGAAITAAIDSSSRCVQLLGAMGVTHEADAHLYLRRAHQSALALESSPKAYRAAADIERAFRNV
jgi:alkylation response protein AidB-like acyl-CoA dehydrogenase